MISIQLSTLIIGGALSALGLMALSAFVWMQGYGAGERDKGREKDAEIDELRGLLAITDGARDKLMRGNITLETNLKQIQASLATANGRLAFANAKLESWADPKASKTVSKIISGGPYIVLPSLAFAVLPEELRNRLTAVLQEAEDMGVNWPTGYTVVRHGKGGKAARDAWNQRWHWVVSGGLQDTTAFEQANGGPLKPAAEPRP